MKACVFYKRWITFTTREPEGQMFGSPLHTLHTCPDTSSDIGGDRKPSRREFFVLRIGSHGGVNFNIIASKRGRKRSSREWAREFLRIPRGIQLLATLRRILISRRTCPL